MASFTIFAGEWNLHFLSWSHKSLDISSTEAGIAAQKGEKNSLKMGSLGLGVKIFLEMHLGMVNIFQDQPLEFCTSKSCTDELFFFLQDLAIRAVRRSWSPRDWCEVWECGRHRWGPSFFFMNSVLISGDEFCTTHHLSYQALQQKRWDKPSIAWCWICSHQQYM